MRGLRVGLFLDESLGDHSYTVLSLRNALARSDIVLDCLAVTPSDSATHEALREMLRAPFSSFDGISFDAEFAEVDGFSSMLFAFDNASRFSTRDWTEASMDRAALLPRAIAFDVRAWAFYRAAFGRDLPLLPAPLPSFRGLSHLSKTRVAIIMNDLALAERSLDEIRRAILTAAPNCDIIEISNSYGNPATQKLWLDPKLVFAGAHIHIGQPMDTISLGRLIDSMSMQAPCIVFDDAHYQRDSGVSLTWRPPSYIADVNVVRSTSASALIGAIRLVLQDRAWSNTLVRSGLREVESFQKQFQTAFVQSFAQSTTSWYAG